MKAIALPQYFQPVAFGLAAAHAVRTVMIHVCLLGNTCQGVNDDNERPEHGVSKMRIWKLVATERRQWTLTSTTAAQAADR